MVDIPLVHLPFPERGSARALQSTTSGDIGTWCSGAPGGLLTDVLYSASNQSFRRWTYGIPLNREDRNEAEGEEDAALDWDDCDGVSEMVRVNLVVERERGHVEVPFALWHR